jgi:hypothetical protein
MIPGDNSSLIPLCKKCHGKFHHWRPGCVGIHPPEGEVAPLCACGCGKPVNWNKGHGWGTWLLGHRRDPTKPGPRPPEGEEPPLCACGCGNEVKWGYCRGWSEYLHGHHLAIVPVGTRQQEPPLCKCGCGKRTGYRAGKGWSEYARGHRNKVEAAIKRKNKKPSL